MFNQSINQSINYHHHHHHENVNDNNNSHKNDKLSKIMIKNYHDSIEETTATILYCFNRIIAQAGHVLQVTDVKQALPINDIDA